MNTKFMIFLGFLCLSGVAHSQTLIADSLTEFSGNQGENDWNYGYYYTANYEQSQPRGSNFVIAKKYLYPANRWYPYANKKSKVYVSATGGHPQAWWQTCKKKGKPRYCVGYEPIHVWFSVRRWTSDVTGRIRIDGTVQRHGRGGDGVITDVVLVDQKVEKGLHPKFIKGDDLSKYEFSEEIDIEVGDTIDFVISSGGKYANSDGVDYSIKIYQITPP